MSQWYKDFVHNVLVHPLLPFLPVDFGTRWHDNNATWAFGLDRLDELAMETKGEQDVSTTQTIIITGDITEGLEFIGPFPGYTAAIDYLACNGTDSWVITDLIDPSTEDQT